MRYLRVKSYDFGVMTGLILMPSFQLDMTGIDENTNGIMISSLLAGAITGAIFSGPLADALGRKALMALGTVIFIFDQSEIAPKNMRGRLMSIQQFALTGGMALSYWIDYKFVDVSGSTGWSPRYSIYKKHSAEALETLSKIRGDGTTTHKDVLMEFTEMKQNITFEHKIFHNDKYKRLICSGPENNRRRLLLGMAVQIFQQLTGINAILLFAPQIFQAAGLTGRDIALFANGLSGSINLLATIPAIFFSKYDHSKESTGSFV
ncbi:hypothetical protein RO3G_12268 [Rhizopus delemar RA 99-880]|uniref:Major facilitator superfamily (MFS) profile domain-containing protein n=1 Tax=Rhizopus delemar (strain RA 99-880 / ATCC MYA-4621 / FGSC 9543 / NRRL 43880) TaxID=246409 RepID=I1CGH7_RHIO9|nr:hypothetical protein RO3G_12268 [Rhizopus delemar RA 99-880]|eukprot:EIE87557.1 hypothetical protein RO3G_12268 [Rhizopus delemar RA 99-880]